jgi:hypothetical protein
MKFARRNPNWRLARRKYCVRVTVNYERGKSEAKLDLVNDEKASETQGFCLGVQIVGSDAVNFTSSELLTCLPGLKSGASRSTLLHFLEVRLIDARINACRLAGSLCDPFVFGVYPSRDRSIILNQVHRYPCRQRLPDAILCTLAGRERSVQRDAHIRPRLDHLAVARSPRGVSESLPIRPVRFGLDTEVLACFRESVVDPCRSTMDDH